MSERTLQQVFSGQPTSDGDGVKLTRLIGQPDLKNLDPFLMLDAFGTDRPLDYIGGFPPHPHRGFETVTYLLEGKMRHRDNQGNEGVIEPGGVQWMTAGRGIIHSEMPEQEQGRLAGFQLWVNLPAHAKMSEPAYQEYPPEKIPQEVRPSGTRIKVIAGRTREGTEGIIQNDFVDPTYLDVTLQPGDDLEHDFNADARAFVYVYQGSVSIGERTLQERQLGVLSGGETIRINNHSEQPSGFLLIAGSPINEPIVQRGPFVMNTIEEVRQAFSDYEDGRF